MIKKAFLTIGLTALALTISQIIKVNSKLSENEIVIVLSLMAVTTILGTVCIWKK